MAKYVCMGATLKCTFGNGNSPSAADDSEQAESHHYGFHPDSQHPALRHVPVAEQPHGGLRHFGRDGRPDTHALHPGNRGSLGTGRQTTDYQHAGSAG